MSGQIWILTVWHHGNIPESAVLKKDQEPTKSMQNYPACKKPNVKLNVLFHRLIHRLSLHRETVPKEKIKIRFNRLENVIRRIQMTLVAYA